MALCSALHRTSVSALAAQTHPGACSGRQCSLFVVFLVVSCIAWRESKSYFDHRPTNDSSWSGSQAVGILRRPRWGWGLQLVRGRRCDDEDAEVRPGVYDAPDDGIDQNCTGSDLRLSEPVIPPPQRDPVEPRKDWNVVLLTIDTLRADVVSEEMPRLTALAAEGQVFSRAYSHGAATYWTMASLQTSKMPSRLHLDRTRASLVYCWQSLTQSWMAHGSIRECHCVLRAWAESGHVCSGLQNQ